MGRTVFPERLPGNCGPDLAVVLHCCILSGIQWYSDRSSGTAGKETGVFQVGGGTYGNLGSNAFEKKL